MLNFKDIKLHYNKHTIIRVDSGLKDVTILDIYLALRNVIPIGTTIGGSPIISNIINHNGGYISSIISGNKYFIVDKDNVNAVIKHSTTTTIIIVVPNDTIYPRKESICGISL